MCRWVCGRFGMLALIQYQMDGMHPVSGHVHPSAWITKPYLFILEGSVC